MSLITHSIVTAILIVSELVYFRVANRYSIIDNPNNRSSHTGNIIRGGGVIFFAAFLCWFVLSHFSWPFFMVGVTLVAVISFLDDIKPQRSSIRFTIHLIAVALLFYQTSIYSWPIWLTVLAAIVCIGTINAFNFMDGINGITGIYGLVTLVTFLFIHNYIIQFTDPVLIVTVLLSVLIFLFFNFRKRAICFAGDVGSVSLAFVQIFLLLQLINQTEHLGWVLLVLVFGIDSVVTIIFRLKRKENIFQPHRTHLYQFLANEMRLDHRLVALIYGGAQVIVNAITIMAFNQNRIWLIFAAGLAVALIYLFVRIAISRHIKNEVQAS